MLAAIEQAFIALNYTLLCSIIISAKCSTRCMVQTFSWDSRLDKDSLRQLRTESIACCVQCSPELC